MDTGDRYVDALIACIKGEMTARDWDRYVLADKTGLSYGTVGRVLRGDREMTFVYVAAFARAFDWTASELVIKAEERMRRSGHDPAGPGIHPEDEAIIDSSDKLTKRQRAQVKRALSDESGNPHLSHMQNPGESVESSERRPRRAGSA